MVATCISVDPSLRATGIAYWQDETLVAVGILQTTKRKHGRGAAAWGAIALAAETLLYTQVRQPDGQYPWALPGPPTQVYTEHPQIYGGGKGGSPDDILQVAGACGAVVGAIGAAKVKGFLPWEWKRNVKKAVFTRRIIKRLTDTERKVIGTWRESYTGRIPLKDDVEDAVGIGLWGFGRL